VASRGLGAFDYSSAVFHIPYLMPGYQPGTFVAAGVPGKCLPLYNASMPQPGPDGKSTQINCSLSNSAETALGMAFAGLALYSLFALKGASKLVAVPAAWLALGHLLAGGGGF
jgi:hypothetical protein